MNLLHRILTKYLVNPVQPSQPPEPTLSGPVLVVPCPAEPAWPELQPEIESAAREGIALFRVDVTSRHSLQAKAFLATATTDIPLLRKLGAENSESQFGMRMGDTVFAVEMQGSLGREQFCSLSQLAAQTTDEDGDWQTRILQGSNTSWALYRCPDRPMRRRGRILASALSIVGSGQWVPCPGSKFSGITYSYVNDARIKEAPEPIARLAFEDPDEDLSQKVLVFSGGRTR